MGKTALSFFYLGREGAAARERGKMERKVRGIDSPPHLGQRWSEEGCPRRRAELGGSGAATQGRGARWGASSWRWRAARRPIYRPSEAGEGRGAVAGR